MPTTARSPYGNAIDATIRLLQSRARDYRDLVMAVSVLGIVALGWSAWWRSVRPLALFLLLLPLCLEFLWHDRRLLNRWRRPLLEDWAAGSLDFAALRGALLANPALPAGTLAAMLTSLPHSGALRDERAVSLADRRAAALAAGRVDARQSAALAVRLAVGALAVFACLDAVLPVMGWSVAGTALAASGCARALSRRRASVSDVSGR